MDLSLTPPPDIKLLVLSSTKLTGQEELVLELAPRADLVVALGNVDLRRAARLLPADIPALCVMGAQDAEVAPPEPFRALHGSGVTFKEWRVAGLSGAKRPGPGVEGFYVDEAEAASLLGSMPACDLLITNAPPAGLPNALAGADEGLEALTQYLKEKPPIYHFYGSDSERFDYTRESLVAGMSGVVLTPALRFI